MYKEEAYYTSDGEKVRSSTTHFTGRFHEDKGYSLYAYGNTISSRISVDFPSGMSKTDIANMMLLSKRLLPNVNVVGYRASKGHKPMNIVQMGNAIGLKERQAYRFIKKMIGLGMMVRAMTPILGGYEVQYIMNPLFFLNGKTISDPLYLLFQPQLDEHLPKWVRDTYKKRMENAI